MKGRQEKLLHIEVKNELPPFLVCLTEMKSHSMRKVCHSHLFCKNVQPLRLIVARPNKQMGEQTN